jgi:GTP-binding protein
VLTKAETVSSEQLDKAAKAVKKANGAKQPYIISAQTHEGVLPLLREAVKLVKVARTEQERVRAEAAVPVIDITTLPDVWHVTVEGEGVFRVTGDRMERFANQTNFDQDDAVERLRDILRKTGVSRELRRQGVQDGDTIRLGDAELAWVE